MPFMLPAPSFLSIFHTQGRVGSSVFRVLPQRRESPTLDGRKDKKTFFHLQTN